LKVIDRDNLQSVDGAARAEKLRRRSELPRRAAGHPTEGGTNTDRILLAMVERLEREVDVAPAPTITEDAGDDGPTSRDGEVNPMTETKEERSRLMLKRSRQANSIFGFRQLKQETLLPAPRMNTGGIGDHPIEVEEDGIVPVVRVIAELL
jgi:hypothetical protein